MDPRRGLPSCRGRAAPVTASRQFVNFVPGYRIMIRITHFPTPWLWSLLILFLVTATLPAAEKMAKQKKQKAKKAAAAKKSTEEKPAPSASDSPAATEKPAASAAGGEVAGTAAVTKGPLKIELTLTGNLEGVSMQEVTLDPKQWTQFEVVEAVAPGTRVKAGDSLLKLDTEKIDDAIRDLEMARPLAELDLRLATESYVVLEKSTPIDLEMSERAKKMAEQDFDLYTKVEGQLAKNSAEFQLKSSEQNLEYVNEELKQLEKMYKADDLTEETEEIILKRSRNDVERAKFLAEQARARHDRALRLDLPRAAEQQKFNLQQAELTWERARSSLPASYLRQKLDLEKKRVDLKKSDERLAELKHDRELMNVKSPAAGIVFYGRSQNGKWTTASALVQKYRPGGQVMPHESLFTIVGDGGWIVRSSISEKDLASVQAGLAGRAKFAAYPKEGVPLKVKDVAVVPDGDGTFDVAFDLTGKSQQPLIAGMSCEIKLTTYYAAEALTVPSKSVFADDVDEDKQFVFVANAQGKPEKRAVVSGRVKGEMTEITSGLSASDKVFLQKPTP